MKMLSAFTHSHVVANVYAFLSSAELKSWYFKQCW